MPLNWLFLMIFFLMIFLLYNISNYFIIKLNFNLNNNNTTNHMKPKKLNNLNKWKW